MIQRHLLFHNPLSSYIMNQYKYVREDKERNSSTTNSDLLIRNRYYALIILNNMGDEKKQGVAIQCISILLGSRSQV